MTQDTVTQLEDSIKASRQFVEMDKALERLESNADFKKIIVEGYLEKEAVRLVHLKGNAAMQTPERKASILAQIDAISGLLQYFQTISQQASMAVNNIASSEAMLEELSAEELQRG